PQNLAQVSVTVPAGTLTGAVGAIIIGDGTPGGSAVVGANSGNGNRTDEIGAANPGSSGVTPGTLNAPQLKQVIRVTTTNPFGQTTFVDQYVFTQPLMGGAGQPINPAGIHLYDQDGTQMNCSAAAGAATVGTPGGTPNNTVVTCSAYFLANPNGTSS